METILGLTGMVLSLIGFAMLQMGYWKTTNRLYIWSNVIACVLLLALCIIRKDPIYGFLEVIWLGFSVKEMVFK